MESGCPACATVSMEEAAERRAEDAERELDKVMGQLEETRANLRDVLAERDEIGRELHASLAAAERRLAAEIDGMRGAVERAAGRERDDIADELGLHVMGATREAQ